jgi:hypothetical protein
MPVEVDDSKGEAPEPTAKKDVTPGETAAVSGERRCPLCGGPTKRTWGDVSIFNLTTFLIFLMLAPFMHLVFMWTRSGMGAVLSLTWIGIVLISFWALPITSAVAVVARPRCRRCGHLSLPRLNEAKGDSPARFPLRFALSGEAILLGCLIGGLLWLRTAPGLETLAVGLRFVAWVVMAGFVLGSGLLVQAMVWRRLRARMTGAERDGRALVLAAVVLSAGWLALTACDHRVLSHRYDPVRRSPTVLDRAGLAALPPSARDVKVHSWAFMLSGKYTLRFTAEPNDIERFLDDSPSLQGVTCRQYSRERMMLRSEDYVSIFGQRNTQGNDYFATQRDVPRWYQQEIRGRGRRYDVKWYDGKYQGELLVDDESHTVYVHVDRF